MINTNFENLTIYDLRVLARELHIKSPTTKNRALLIKLINLAINCKLPTTETDKKNKGRPAKSRMLINVTGSKPLLEKLLIEINLIQNKLEQLKNEITKNVE